ncbi:MAG: NADH-quinone oxidoreductase subunit G [Candidimonas sp.]|nr:MAG: NADH-quinone oxidoreductase subunit G [Candidimonas sp.]
MVELTIDGIKVQAQEGTMVIRAAHEAGIYVPHFCYHKKLTIAANCRMCLVEIEKAPKVMPACATPVTNGMVVYTNSAKAIAAQKSVMEFLLINHPLDCPVCDQGGECQLQDLAVGYGASGSRYKETKRVVVAKPMGPLISAEEMQRCIHCTRCIRFGIEIGGIMEIGMVNRTEFSEITTFVGRAVDSELSGNMIDICPVGALTSKPFRFAARTWELARRRSVSPHDSLGANLVVQVKDHRVLRVVPFENEPVNECWISDRDRFAYKGLYVEDRLTHPMIKEGGQWREASWSDALTAVVKGIGQVRERHGDDQLGAIGSYMATTEELALLARLTRALGSQNVDFRLRRTDDGLDGALAGVPWLGLPIAELERLDRVLVVGSFLRKDHPLMAHRLREAVKRGTQVSFVGSVADDPLFVFVHDRMNVAPSAYPRAIAQVLVAAAQAAGQPVPAALADVAPSDDARRIAASLASGKKTAVFIGNVAAASPQASLIAANASALAALVGASFGFLTEGGNTVGGYLAQATPRDGGLNARQMLAQPLKAYLVLHAEPALDADEGARAVQSLRAAEFAVALTSYRSAAEDWAQVMLPISPFTETSGTFVNAEGRVQSFKGTVETYGDTRPAWKVLRVLGNLFQLPGFDDETSESVRDSVLVDGVQGRLSNEIRAAVGTGQALDGLERIADVPIYRTDPMVRRAEPLQQTSDSRAPEACMAGATLRQLGIASGARVRVRSAQGEVALTALGDDTVAPGCVRISAGFAETAPLGSAFAQITVEQA